MSNTQGKGIKQSGKRPYATSPKKKTAQTRPKTRTGV